MRLDKLRTIGFNLVRGPLTFVSYWSGYAITPKPSVMYLELTYRCNLRCGFCERWKVGPSLASQELTTAQVKRILTEAYRIGVRYLGLTGGEVLLRRDIFELGQFAKKLGMNVSIASNGTLINERNIDSVLSSFDSVAISFDGVSATTHDSLRGVPGAFEAALATLTRLTSHKMACGINMVVNRQNFREIEDYINFFSKSVKHIQLTPIHNYEVSYLKVKEELQGIDIDEFNKEWSRLSRKYPFLTRGFYRNLPLFLSDPTRLHSAFVCFAASAVFFVDPYGEVFPCEFYRQSMGNLKEKSLVEIWREAGQLRRLISSPQRPCVCWTHCIVPLNIKLTKYIALKKSV